MPPPPSRTEPGEPALFLGRDATALRSYLASFLLAAVVGVGGGLAALGFQRLTDLSRRVWLGAQGAEGFLPAAASLPWWRALLIPAAGAAVASLFLYVLFPRLGRRGASDVLETVSLRKGGIDVPAVLLRSAASSAVIGSGGSIGREGPIIQIAAGIASAAGRAAKLPPRDLSVLIACGAAAGMAGAYNAPIGAALFVMEVILGSFVMEQFAPVMVSSVTSALTVRAVAGTASVYRVPRFEVSSPWEALPIFALGLLSALVGWGFLRVLGAIEDRLHALPVPRALLPVLGGLLSARSASASRRSGATATTRST